MVNQNMLFDRQPPGKVMQGVLARRQSMAPVRFRRDILQMNEDEFCELLKEERASAKMIAQEVAVFRKLKAHLDSKEEVKRKRRKHAEREVGEELDVYVEAEIRRIAGSAADDILREMHEDGQV